jgi:hypothetical protein
LAFPSFDETRRSNEMTNPPPGEQGGKAPERPRDNAEAELGGADAVEKTTYVQGKGTSPEARRPMGTPAPQVSVKGNSPIVWVLLVFIILIAIAYGAGVFR